MKRQVVITITANIGDSESMKPVVADLLRAHADHLLDPESPIGREAVGEETLDFGRYTIAWDHRVFHEGTA